MSAPQDRSPDAWLFPPVGAPWPGTVVDATRVLVHAPADVLTASDGELRLVTANAEGRWRDGEDVVTVTVLGDGPAPGQLAALVAVEGEPLVPRPGLIEEIIVASLLAVPTVASTPEGRPIPEAIGLPSPPTRPAGGGGRLPRIFDDRQPGEVERSFFCMLFPWFCYEKEPLIPGLPKHLSVRPEPVMREPRLSVGPRSRPATDPISLRPPWPPRA